MDLPELDPLIHQRTRLGIITLLYRNREAALTWVRNQLELTFGNLDSHASRLEEAGYIERRRKLTPDGFQVRLRITEEGDRAYREYLAALRAYLEAEQDAEDPPQPRAEETGG